MRLISQIRTRTGLELALRSLFEHPTVKEFAAQLNAVKTARSYQPLLALNKSGKQPPLFCFPPAGGISTVYKNLSNALGNDQPVWGLQARGVDDDENQTDQSVKEAASTYIKAIKAIQPNGPYYLLGHSLGGSIAQEAAVQLEDNGDVVATVFILDSVTTYPQAQTHHTSEDDKISDTLKGLLRDATDKELPPEADELLSFFQAKFEDLGMIPVDTPRAFVMSFLSNMAIADKLTKNHKPSRSHTEIVYFRATKDSDPHTESESLFNWQPYTEKPLRQYEVSVSHVQMLWQPASYEFIASKVREAMRTDAPVLKTGQTNY
jgi:thioesterase domain-containing protein